jgi:uncharacterized transporter YbjL
VTVTTNPLAGPETLSVASATVYPLTMILPVVCAQLMVLLFASGTPAL